MLRAELVAPSILNPSINNYSRREDKTLIFLSDLGFCTAAPYESASLVSRMALLILHWTSFRPPPPPRDISPNRYPYRNIFQLIEKELDIDPFTPWTQSAQYSPEGLEVRALETRFFVAAPPRGVLIALFSWSGGFVVAFASRGAENIG